MDTKQVFDLKLDDVTLAGMVTRRASKSKAHWDKLYDLTKVRDANEKLYTTKYVNDLLIDKRYEDIFADNRLFVAVRTILPFVTSRMTQPEVIPAKGDDLSINFAADFERIMVEVADEAYARDKIKLAVQDLLTGQRVGVLKWCYDPDGDCLRLEHIKPDAIVIDHTARLHEEPRFVQETQERTVAELVKQFPDSKDLIFKTFGIQKGVPSQLEQVHKITESWLFVDDDNGDSQLAIVWMYHNTVFGKITDPNWIQDSDNLVTNQMLPYVFINFLNDGTGLIDHTSFIEQAQYSQRQYDKRGQTIADNAAYGGIGVPVFAGESVKEETAAKLRFNPEQRLILDGVTDVRQGFGVWKADNLQPFIFEDKVDQRNNVDNTFGTPNIFRAEQSDNNTLGQDVLIRDQAEGRQQELVQALDNAMKRFYQLEAQFIYRYFDEEKMYNFIGEDGKFEAIAISSELVKKNLGIKIRIKSGSSLPVDRSQKRMVAIELMKANRISTLKLYKELGLDEPEEAFKQHIQEQLMPASLLEEQDKMIFSRDAAMDLEIVIGGKVPDERDDIEEEYIAYLNSYLLTNKYELLPKEAQKRVSDYVQAVIVQAQKKAEKLGPQQEGQNIPMGQLRKVVSTSYKDAPPDIQRQIEQADGFQPSAMGDQAMPYQLPKETVSAPGQSEPPQNNINHTAP